MTRAYVGVGANLGDREATIRAALAALPGVVAVSPCARPSRSGGRSARS